MIRAIDRSVESSEGPIQFYKLRNARATEVLQTLLALQEAYGLNGGAGGFGGGLQNQVGIGQNGFFPNTGGFGQTNPLSAAANQRQQNGRLNRRNGNSQQDRFRPPFC